MQIYMLDQMNNCQKYKQTVESELQLCLGAHTQANIQT